MLQRMRDLSHLVQNFQEVAKGAHEMDGKSFKMKHKVAGDAEQRSFQAEVAKELYRLANAPASDYEVFLLLPEVMLSRNPKLGLGLSGKTLAA